MTTYGFVGLGHQGTPMAERMITGGLQPWVWARRSDVLGRYVQSDAHVATSAAEVGARSDVIGLCLYDAEATDAVLFGPDGVLTDIRSGTVLAVHATVGPEYVQSLARRVSDRGVCVVDAPVSGGPAAAEGALLVMVGGDEQARQACEPMFATYAGKVVHLGEVGAAQSAKLLNNALMAAITGLVFDAFDLGDALGIDREGLGAVLAGGSAANPSIGYYLAAGAEQLSISAWPTLHKDIALVQALVTGTPLADALLVPTAASTIAVMEALRADYQRTKDAS